MTLEEYFYDFRQRLLAEFEIRNKEFQRTAFLDMVSGELTETGFLNGFEHCHYRGKSGKKVDGFYLNEDEASLDLHLADFQNRKTMESLTMKTIKSDFKQLRQFFLASRNKALHEGLDESTPEYRLARAIHDRIDRIQRVNFILTSERRLNVRIKSIGSHDLDGVKATYSVWDISRLHRQHCARRGEEPLDVDLKDMFKKGLPCIRAQVGTRAFLSYLVVVSGEVLAALYEKYGARLLEQNVRCFLQARGAVNRGIRDTIVTEPHMFFTYNNGITCTAKEVEVRGGHFGSEIVRIVDLQIVNGGQTTASLYHASKLKEAPDLSQIFVQMKLSVVGDHDSEELVSKISLYANTQNKVSAADLRSNHPFHVRIEEFSRRIWAPAAEGELHDTKWFYERSRGQYLDAQSKMTRGDKKRFKAEYPRTQKFAKTDLAKFENVWEDHPVWVNLGAQKNFLQYAKRISQVWDQAPDQFDEDYYHRAVARAIVFRATERLVSQQDWYEGGYRANIVAYTLATANALGKDNGMELDYRKIWSEQRLDLSFCNQLALIAKFVRDVLYLPTRPVQNCSEWAKKGEFWNCLRWKFPEIKRCLNEEFTRYFVQAKRTAA